MPLVAVAGAIAGATSLATVGAAGLGIFGTISAIGGIVAGIGAITGNSTLTKIGAIAGLAGGVGAFASSQGWLASASATETATGTASEAGMIDQFKNAASGAEAATPTQGLMDSVNPTDMRLAAGTQTSPVDGSVLEQSTGGLTQTTSDLATQRNSLASDATKTMGAGTATVDGGNPSSLFNAAKDSSAANSALGLTASDVSTAGAGAGGSPILDTLKKFGTLMHDNKELSAIGANFIGGMFDERKKAETDLLNARADEIRQQAANGNAVPKLGLTLNQSKPVFKTAPATYTPVRPAGLFNAR